MNEADGVIHENFVIVFYNVLDSVTVHFGIIIGFGGQVFGQHNLRWFVGVFFYFCKLG